MFFLSSFLVIVISSSVLFAEEIIINSNNWLDYVDTISGSSTPHEGRSPVHLFDGSHSSHWHSTSSNPSLPQSITITFIDTVHIKRIRLINRTGEPSGTMPLGALKTGMIHTRNDTVHIQREKPTVEGEDTTLAGLNLSDIEFTITYTESHGNSSNGEENLYGALGELELVLQQSDDTTVTLKNTLNSSAYVQATVYDLSGNVVARPIVDVFRVRWNGMTTQKNKVSKGLFVIRYYYEEIGYNTKYLHQ